MAPLGGNEGLAPQCPNLGAQEGGQDDHQIADDEGRCRDDAEIRIIGNRREDDHHVAKGTQDARFCQWRKAQEAELAELSGHADDDEGRPVLQPRRNLAHRAKSGTTFGSDALDGVFACEAAGLDDAQGA